MSNAVILKHTKDKNVKYTAHFTCFRIHKLKWIFLHFLDRIISWVSAQACTNEGAEVFNACGEACFCINGRMQNCCRMRKHFSSMTEADRTLYVATVRRASTDSRYRDQYRRLINMHQRLFQTGIHQKDQFLPWHRW